MADLGSNAVTFVNLVDTSRGADRERGCRPDRDRQCPGGVRSGAVRPGAVGQAASGQAAWVSGGKSLVSVSFASKPVVGSTIPVGHLAEAVAIAMGCRPPGSPTEILT